MSGKQAGISVYFISGNPIGSETTNQTIVVWDSRE
jgi:hypothetical protein